MPYRKLYVVIGTLAQNVVVRYSVQGSNVVELYV